MCLGCYIALLLRLAKQAVSDRAPHSHSQFLRALEAGGHAPKVLWPSASPYDRLRLRGGLGDFVDDSINQKCDVQL